MGSARSVQALKNKYKSIAQEFTEEYDYYDDGDEDERAEMEEV